MTHFKHTLRNSIISFFAYTGIASVYRFFSRRPHVRIVVFHDVPDRTWFAAMIDTLRTSSIIITPDDFARGTFDSKRVNTLVTFDDGYASWVDVALPVLDARGVKALFFVSSALIDSAHNEEASNSFMRERLYISPRSPLTWDGVRALHRAGHTIGGHARTHANLTLLDAATLQTEIEEDKHAIEAALGAEVADFAYPFGTVRHVNEAAAAAVAAAGYIRAYTAISRFVPPNATFHIPRMCIESGLSLRALVHWIRGAYDLFDMLKQLCVR